MAYVFRSGLPAEMFSDPLLLTKRDQLRNKRPLQPLVVREHQRQYTILAARLKVGQQIDVTVLSKGYGRLKAAIQSQKKEAFPCSNKIS